MTICTCIAVNKSSTLSNIQDILYFYPPVTAKVACQLIWLGCCKLMTFK